LQVNYESELPIDMLRINSFDVFDTVITRVFGSPESVFISLGKQLHFDSSIRSSPEAFARSRIQAEHRALKNIGEFTTLRHIYEELKSSLNLTNEKCSELMALEQELQAKLLRPIEPVMNHIQSIHDQGQSVIYISDMHLSAEFIQKQLVFHNLWKDGDRCYVSCEYGRSKSSGELFKEVLEQERILPEQMLHTGNCPQADDRSARKIGVQTQPFVDGNLNRYEKVLDSYSWSTEGFSSAMAGASRLARLTVSATGDDAIAIRGVTAGVVAPMLVGYVLSVLKHAQNLNLERVYFLSRDGQVLLEIARKLKEKLNLSCELKYLYASRVSWNFPAIESIDEDWIWDPLSEYCSLEYLFDRLNLDFDEVSEDLAVIGLTKKDWRRSLSQSEVKKLRVLLKEGKASQIVLDKAAHKKNILLQYLEQEGLFDSSQKGIVDLGWAATMYRTLTRLIDENNSQSLRGLYFGLNKNALDSNTLEAYFFDQRRQTGLPIKGIRYATEIFCSANHGTVLGFKKKDGKISPILEQNLNQEEVAWWIPILRATIDCFIDNLVLDSSLVNPYSDVRECVAQVFTAFWLTPSYLEAKAWGKIAWEEHLPSKGTYRFDWASSYGWEHIIQLLFSGSISKHHQCEWDYASMAITPPLIQNIIQFIVRFRKKFSRFIS
jgi:FMN phosphatase YigB (HAD superfamily)